MYATYMTCRPFVASQFGEVRSQEWLDVPSSDHESKTFIFDCYQRKIHHINHSLKWILSNWLATIDPMLWTKGLSLWMLGNILPQWKEKRQRIWVIQREGESADAMVTSVTRFVEGGRNAERGRRSSTKNTRTVGRNTPFFLFFFIMKSCVELGKFVVNTMPILHKCGFKACPLSLLCTNIFP